jgi:hypothetical protein
MAIESACWPPDHRDQIVASLGDQNAVHAARDERVDLLQLAVGVVVGDR